MFAGDSLALGRSGKNRRRTRYQFIGCASAWFCTRIARTPLAADSPFDATHRRSWQERGLQERAESTSFSCSWLLFLSVKSSSGPCPSIQLQPAFLQRQMVPLFCRRDNQLPWGLVFTRRSLSPQLPTSVSSALVCWGSNSRVVFKGFL